MLTDEDYRAALREASAMFDDRPEPGTERGTRLLEGLRAANTVLWRTAQDVENPIDPDDLASFAWLMSYLVELVNALESCQSGFESEVHG